MLLPPTTEPSETNISDFLRIYYLLKILSSSAMSATQGFLILISFIWEVSDGEEEVLRLSIYSESLLSTCRKSSRGQRIFDLLPVLQVSLLSLLNLLT